MSWEEIKLQMSNETKQRLEDRHILEGDIKKVIKSAETELQKLYQPDTNKYLARKRLGNFTVNVEYTSEENEYTVLSAYSHRAKLGKV
jgi:hypothetical protein